MSRSETADTTDSGGVRWRARCPDCAWSRTHDERSRANAHKDRGCPRCNRGVGVSKVRPATDGGEEIGDDRVDPEDLPKTHNPGVVELDGQGPVYVAHYSVTDSGWVKVREWTGLWATLPPHRVRAIRSIRTERVGEPDDLGYRTKRVADEGWREAATSDDGEDGVDIPLSAEA